MNKIYLTEDLKSYYADCLKKEILLNNINKEIQEPLLSINKSENIRSIFSKKGRHDITNCLHSYLRIAFTSKVEHTLLTLVIPSFKANYKLKDRFVCKCSVKQPYITQRKRQITEENNGSEWLINQEYFNVSHIIFDLQKGDPVLHDKFWTELNAYLSEL